MRLYTSPHLPILATLMLAAGCTTVSTTAISEDEIEDMSETPLAVYSDYGRAPVEDSVNGLYRYDIYVGGSGGCDGGAFIFAKRKLDRHKKKFSFASYTIKQSSYVRFPLSKCELLVEFKKPSEQKAN
jgi:hypothetical protein